MPSPLPRWVRWADRSWLGLFHPVASFPSDIGLPHMSDGSAPTSSIFEACSAFTHVTACLLATSPSDVFSRRLRRFCHLHRRSDSYQLERPSCRMGIAPIEEPNLSRRTDMHCQPWQSFVGDLRQPLFPPCAKWVSLRLSAALQTVCDDALHVLPAPPSKCALLRLARLSGVTPPGYARTVGAARTGCRTIRASPSYSRNGLQKIPVRFL